MKQKEIKKVHLIIFRPNGEADIMIFKDGSDELEEFIELMEEEGRGFVIASEVIECLGKA